MDAEVWSSTISRTRAVLSRRGPWLLLIALLPLGPLTCMKVVEPDQTLSRIELSPDDVNSTARSDTTRFTATPISEAGTEMSDVDFSWSSSNPDVARVSGDGVAHVVGEGQASITVSAQDVDATAQLSADFRTETTVDASGGTVESSDEKLQLDVPQGAVAEETTVEVTTVAEPPAEFAWAPSTGRHYRLEPHGLQLDTAITGTFRLEGSAQGVRFIKFNEETTRARAVSIRQRDLENGTATFDLNSFSIFGIFAQPDSSTTGWAVYDVRWSIPTVRWYFEPPQNPDQSYLDRSLIRSALLRWTRQTELRFEEVSSADQAQLVFEEADSISDHDGTMCAGGFEIFATDTVDLGMTCFDKTSTFLEDELDKNDQATLVIASQVITNRTWARSTLIHEVGHALGLDHPWKDPQGSTDAVMEQGTSVRELHEWDRQALWYHYARNDSAEVSIDSPSSGAAFTEGDTVTFEGTVNDPEDGALTGSRLIWSSNQDGRLGTGTTVSRSDLSVGEHRITLQAEDRDHLIVRDTVTITVERDTTGSGSGSYDGFEDGTLTDIWTINRDDPYASGTVDQTRPLFGNYSYHVTVGSSRDAHFAIHHDFSSVQDTATFSAWIYLQGNGSGTTFHFTVRNPNTSAAAGLHAGPWGDIRYATDQVSGGQDKNVLVNGYQSGKWYRFEMFVDPGAGTVDFEITDRNGNSWSDTGVPATVEFTRIKVGASDYNLDYEVWADSVSYKP